MRMLRVAIAVSVALLTTHACAAQELGVVKVPDATRETYPWLEDYMIVLERFPLYAERGWHSPYRGDESLGYFGDARHDENGQRTLSNFIFVYAVLATQEGYDPAVSGVSREMIRAHCLAAIRYALRTHVTGDLPCTDDSPWGNHWQSPWWSGKLAAGAQLVRSYLTEEERSRLRRLLSHEATRLVERGRIPIGEYADTKSEENAWDTEVLAWAIELCPDDPHREDWRALRDMLAMNTLSTPRDLRSRRRFAGRPVKQWVVGANIHSDFTIENHRFFHICYMACPLHSFAWNYYASQRCSAQPPPETTFFHVRDVWAKLKRCALWNGRFAYVGGKDWPRYAYGLYFMMPALVVYQTKYADADARLLERLRFAAFEREQRYNNNGSFFSTRFTKLQMDRWPAEWETDAACNLAACYMLHKMRSAAAPAEAHPGEGGPIRAATLDELDRRINGVTHSPESEFVMVRGLNRFASWCWKPRIAPATGLICSRRGEDMLEWDENLCGAYAAKGAGSRRRVVRHTEATFKGGFATTGLIYEGELPGPPSPYRLEVRDTNVRLGSIEQPDHPIFQQPHRITSVSDLTDLDSITAAGDGWEVLARNQEGGPSILEAKVGQGRLMVVMCDIEQRYTEGRPGGELFENVLQYMMGAGWPKRRQKAVIGYVQGETWGRDALDAMGVKYQPIRSFTATEFRKYPLVFADRTCRRLVPYWPELLEYAKGGGRVLKLCMQDRYWRRDAIGDRPQCALNHFCSAVALPDDATMVRIDLVTAAGAGVVPVHARGLQLRVANDIFNGNERTYYTRDGSFVLGGADADTGSRQVAGGMLCIDGELSVMCAEGESGGALYVEDRGDRHAGLSHDVIYFPYADTQESAQRPCRAGEVVWDSAVAIIAGLDASGTREYGASGAVRRLTTPADTDLRAVELRGQDGIRYIVAANFGREAQSFRLPRTAKDARPRALTRNARLSRLSGEGRVLVVPPMSTGVVAQRR